MCEKDNIPKNNHGKLQNQNVSAFFQVAYGLRAYYD